MITKYGDDIVDVISKLPESEKKEALELINTYGDDALNMVKSNQSVDEAKCVFEGGCGTKASSKKLRNNMLSSGKSEPAYKNAAHHIVAGSSPKAAEARAILNKYNIDINSADNGVFLPTEKGVSDAAYHPSVHTNEYYRKVNNLLKNAESRDDVLDILDMIREELLAGIF